MNRAACFRLADTANDERLDIRGFDFHIDEGGIANRGKHGRERGNLYVTRQSVILQFGSGDFRDSTPRSSRSVDFVVVMDHQRAVAGSVYVELDCIGAKLDCSQKSRNGVFGERLVRSAVRDLLGGVSARWRQVSPGVVALGTVCAKL